MKIETIEVCRTCKHRQRWMNDFSPKVTQVCELKKGRTQMGFRKIKVTDPACDKLVINMKRRNNYDLQSNIQKIQI